MQSNKSRLFDVTVPTRIAYADKPINRGGSIQYISIAALEGLLNIKYDENIYVDRSILPAIQMPADHMKDKNRWYEYKGDVIELLNDPTKHLVICKMGEYGYGVVAATDLPKHKIISLYSGTLIHRKDTPKVAGEKVLAFQTHLHIRESLQSDTPLMFPNQELDYGFSLRNGRGIGSLFQHLPNAPTFSSIEQLRTMFHQRDGQLHDINLLKLNEELYSTEFVNPDMLQTLATQNIMVMPLIHSGYPVIGLLTVAPIKKGELMGYSFPVPYWQKRNKLPEFFTKEGAPISSLFYRKTFGHLKFNSFGYVGDFKPLLDQVALESAQVTVRDSKGQFHLTDAALVRQKLQHARALPPAVSFTFPQAINIIDGNIILRTFVNLDSEQQYYFYQLRLVLGDKTILKKAFQPIYDIPIDWLRQVYEFNEGKSLAPLLSALQISIAELQTLFTTPEAPELSV